MVRDDSVSQREIGSPICSGENTVSKESGRVFTKFCTSDSE